MRSIEHHIQVLACVVVELFSVALAQPMGLCNVYDLLGHAENRIPSGADGADTLKDSLALRTKKPAASNVLSYVPLDKHRATRDMSCSKTRVMTHCTPSEAAHTLALHSPLRAGHYTASGIRYRPV